MSDKNPLDEIIAANVREAHELLARLDLSDVEREWARATASHVFAAASDAFTENPLAFNELRPAAVPAAAAFALILTRDWAIETEKVADRTRKTKP